MRPIFIIKRYEIFKEQRASYAREGHRNEVGLHIKWPILTSDFNQSRNFLTNFSKIQCQI